MEARLLPILLLLSTATAASAATSSSTTASTSFIKKSCTTTATYPGLCYSSLSPYAGTVKSDPWKLCRSALTVSLQYAQKAKSTYSAMSKGASLTKGEKAAIKQCRDTMADSITQLQQSVQTMTGIIRSRSSSSSSSSSAYDVKFQMSNVKTYASSALTDDDTCKDGLEEEQVRGSLKKQILKWESSVERLTSNALALINGMKY